MGKRRKSKLDTDGHILTFDPASRHAFVTGFTRRKKERRKWAVREILEKERQDRIEAKKDYRNDVKRKWKDLQRAEKRVEALLGPADEVQWLGDLKTEKLRDEEVPVTVAFTAEDCLLGCEFVGDLVGLWLRAKSGLVPQLPFAIYDDDLEKSMVARLKLQKRCEEEVEGPAASREEGRSITGPSRRGAMIGTSFQKFATDFLQVPVTVAFTAEDDDPFGDCEVTTTIGGVSDGAGGHLPLALIGKSGNVLSLLGGEAGRLRDLTGVQDRTMNVGRLRQASARKEEDRRQVALDKAVTKTLTEKNKGPSKKSKRAKGSKGKKGPVGKKERRKRMKRAK
eukprot:symbB.v1.2.030580.t1/scaffold3464.1/size56234/3